MENEKKNDNIENKTKDELLRAKLLGGDNDIDKSMELLSAKPKAKKTVAEIVTIVLKILLFPITLISMLLEKLGRVVKMPITAKTTFVFTAMFSVVLVVFAIFFIEGINSKLIEAGVKDAGAYIGALRVNAIILILVSILIVASLGWLASKSMLKPIRKMTKKIDTITSDNLSARLDEIDTQDELKELTEQINKTLDSLEQSFIRQKNFVSDASHELKTPIAVIQGYANLLSRWGKTQPDILDEGINSIVSESENMKRLVEQLLFLAREGVFKPNKTNVDMSLVVAEIVGGYDMTGRNREISVETKPNIMVNTDKELIVQAVRNLLDNAIKYTPVTEKITVKCYQRGYNVVIKVVDTGVGIEEKDLPKIFDRFYRCDKMRVRSEGSSGLGLTIVRSIMDILGADVRVDSAIGEGTTFTILLPLQENK